MTHRLASRHGAALKRQFTLKRFLAAGALGGLLVGGAAAAWTLGASRIDHPGVPDQHENAFAPLAGNSEGMAAARDAANRGCVNCADGYEIVYLNDPNRERTGIRYRPGREYASLDDQWNDGDYGESYYGEVRFVSDDAAPRMANIHAASEAEQRAAIDRAAAMAERLRTVAQARAYVERAAATPQPSSGVTVHRGARANGEIVTASAQ